MNHLKLKTRLALYIQLFALVFGVASFVPQRTEALLLLLVVDNNSCWVNLIWGCDGDGSNGGGNNTTNPGDTFVSDYPDVPAGEESANTTDAEGNSLSRMTRLRDSLKDPCTAGTTCPGDDLGVLAGKISVNPAYASAQTNTCPLLWIQGPDESNSTVECNLVTNGTSQALPKNAGGVSGIGGQNSYDIEIGRHILSCTRTTTEIVKKYSSNSAEAGGVAADSQTNTWTNTEEYNVRCLPRPSVSEF